jgi:hypothetical protein
MVILDIDCLGDDNLTILFQLCDYNGKDSVCLWGPTSFYDDYDYYFIREYIDVAKCFYSYR